MEKTDRTQLVNGIMLIGLKDYGKYATHLYTYTWADDEVRKKEKLILWRIKRNLVEQK